MLLRFLIPYGSYKESGNVVPQWETRRAAEKWSIKLTKTGHVFGNFLVNLSANVYLEY